MKKIFCILAALLMALSCSKTHSVMPRMNELVLVPFYPGATKASAAGFEDGDKLGIYITQYKGDTPFPLQIGGNWGSNLTLTRTGSGWSLNPKVYWEEDTKFDIYGYYPKMEVSSVDAHPFRVADDQSVTGGVEGMSAYEASDFLWVKVKGATRSASVPMAFQHKMCKVEVSLVKGQDYEGDLPDDAQVYVHNTVTDALVDLATGDVVKDNHKTATSIRARKVSASKFEAIVVPQRLSNRVPLIEVVCGQASYLFESTVVFKSGTVHKVTITLSDNPEKVAIDIGGQIVNW